LSNMPWRGDGHPTVVLPVQVQWEHKIRPPGLPDGVALSFSKEVLRAMQDSLPIYQTLRPVHATHSATTAISSADGHPQLANIIEMDPLRRGWLCMALLATLVNKTSLETALLASGWQLDI